MLFQTMVERLLSKSQVNIQVIQLILFVERCKKMRVHKFHDVKYNPEFPYCIEAIVSDDGFDEVVEVLWFATEEEQIAEFNIWLKDCEPYTEH